MARRYSGPTDSTTMHRRRPQGLQLFVQFSCGDTSEVEAPGREAMTPPVPSRGLGDHLGPLMRVLCPVLHKHAQRDHAAALIVVSHERRQRRCGDVGVGHGSPGSRGSGCPHSNSPLAEPPDQVRHRGASSSCGSSAPWRRKQPNRVLRLVHSLLLSLCRLIEEFGSVGHMVDLPAQQRRLARVARAAPSARWPAGNTSKPPPAPRSTSASRARRGSGPPTSRPTAC